MLAYLAWAVVCLLWGTTYLAIRVAVRTLPDAWLGGMRFTIAGGLLLMILLIRGMKLPPLKQWIHLAWIGISLIGLGNWMVVWAEKTVPSGPTALLIAATPFWIVILERLFRNVIVSLHSQVERWNRYKTFGMLLGFLGVTLLTLPSWNTGWDRGYLFGVFLLQIGCVTWAFGTLYSKHVKVDSHPMMSAALEMMMGGIFLLIVATFKGDFHHVHWEQETLIAFLYLILVGMAGFACFIYALSKLPSSFVSLYAYINPVIAVWLGWLLLDEKVSHITILASTVILGGTWLSKKEMPESWDNAGSKEHA